MRTLADYAVAALTAADPAEKCRLTRAAADAWAAGGLEVGSAVPPLRPARPARPELRAPRDMPKRSTGPIGRIALMHALAHIELNAIDLAWDIIARFTDRGLPRGFYDDWVRVAAEEALHFELVAGVLAARGAAYGDMPAHDGLWEAAVSTADSLEARLAIVPLTHEARGLDTTPASLARLRGHEGTEDITAALDIIYRDEITHVAAGARWFAWLADQAGTDPAAAYHAILRDRYKGGLKPPFNIPARTEAGMPEAWYLPMARG
ncbi:ferritin-like domain-containing protein [Novispirillum sp. DQ9]|uniref:ferritin-like domain-containing protein n=1 Tax=Novispirillum sp. DQ9 TaxID=3398612 RepID=UPI003C79E31F